LALEYKASTLPSTTKGRTNLGNEVISNKMNRHVIGMALGGTCRIAFRVCVNKNGSA